MQARIISSVRRPVRWALLPAIAMIGVLAGLPTAFAADQQATDDAMDNANNWQAEYYTLLNPKNLPVEPVLNEKGEPVVCHVDIAMNQVAFHAWRVNVGRATVYLLDTNRAENEQHFRDLTLRVYGGDSTTRIMQEILLGIGGVRLLRALISASASTWTCEDR